MPLELRRQSEKVLLRAVELVQVVRRGESGDDRGGARAEPGGDGDLAADLEAQAVGGVQELEGSHAEVRAVQGHIVPVRLDLERPRLRNLELEMERERGREHVEAGPEVGRGGGNADEAAALQERSTNAT